MYINNTHTLYYTIQHICTDNTHIHTHSHSLLPYCLWRDSTDEVIPQNYGRHPKKGASQVYIYYKILLLVLRITAYIYIKYREYTVQLYTLD